MLALLLCAACSRSRYEVPGLGDAGAARDAAQGGNEFPSTGIGNGDFVVTGIEPAAGPFSGGTAAIVRGSGFTKDAVVRIGGSQVQPGSVSLVGKGRLQVIVPAGKPGPADVTVTEGDRRATLTHGFQYNAFVLDPATGSTAGGTRVEVTVDGNTHDTLDENTQVAIDGAPCSELVLLTPTRVRCKTPPHALGVVDARVTLLQAKGEEPRELVGKAVYEYIETADNDLGGLSGPKIHGVLNVSVVDSSLGFVIPGAFVLVGDDPNGKYRGVTDASGKITFSGDDLIGPQTVHASRECFERSSILAFDAENATVFMTPILDLACAADGNPGGGGHGQLGSIISGELIFPGSDEFGVNPWDIVPKPRAGEARVAYVFTTQPTLGDSNPNPDISGTMARVEETSATKGERGYLYSIFARPAGLAVYALAGLENASSGRFTPYAMGVTRNLVTSPGDENEHVDIDVSITLDRELAVSLGGMPAAVSGAPDQYRVRSYVDLGGEGVLVREVVGVQLDVITRYTDASVFRFIGQPAFVGTLADASYGVVAGFYTGAGDYPYTEQTRIGVKQSSDALLLSGFLGIPQLKAPLEGAELPKDRTLRFTLDGPTPDAIQIELIGGDGNPAWTLVLPGNAREATLPDLSLVFGQDDIAPGSIPWTVTAFKVDSDFNYDAFQYRDLAQHRVTHSSANAFSLQL